MNVVVPRAASGEQRAAAPDLDVVGVRADAEDVERPVGGEGEHGPGRHQCGAGAASATTRTGQCSPVGVRHSAQGLMPRLYMPSSAVRSLSVSIGAQKPSWRAARTVPVAGGLDAPVHDEVVALLEVVEDALAQHEVAAVDAHVHVARPASGP